jgi:CRP-like cAMP-binding protein
MTDFEKLTQAITGFANLTATDMSLSATFWQHREYRKGEFYNKHRSVCKYLGFALDGVFRSYIVDEKSGEEKNVFLYSGNQFVVTFKSFINQVPCDYHTQALTDANVLCIGIDDLNKLYAGSHGWEHFGRILAQEAFNVVMERTEGFLFRSPEERYLDLIKHHPDIFNTIPLYHIASYLGIQGPSLSRIRKRISGR